MPATGCQQLQHVCREGRDVVAVAMAYATTCPDILCVALQGPPISIKRKRLPLPLQMELIVEQRGKVSHPPRACRSS